jgi:hypothetical protein
LGTEIHVVPELLEGATEGAVGTKMLLDLEMCYERINCGVGCGIHLLVTPAQV